MFTPPNNVPLWPYFVLDSAPVIPKFYWDTYSQEQRIKRLCEELHKVVAYANMLGENINLDHAMIAELQAAFEKFQESGFLDYYEQQLEAWINENMPGIIKQSIMMVWFGLTDDGYFVAYIPESWDDITFDTGMVFGRFDYGRLILRYDVDGSGVIDNTGAYDEESYQALYYLLEQLTERVARNENTLYTALNRGGV